MTHKDKTGKFGRILGDFKIWDKDKEDYVTFTTVMLDKPMQSNMKVNLKKISKKHTEKQRMAN